MGKYFAKYLPVEGGFKRVVKNDQGIPIDYHQEVKLFLCSRDIQVGDKIWDKIGEIYIEVNNKKALELYYKYNNGNWIKVIGPISPQALWVKEGDKFDENQLAYSSKEIECGPFELSQFTRQECSFLETEELEILVKCPTCKTFH